MKFQKTILFCVLTVLAVSCQTSKTEQTITGKNNTWPMSGGPNGNYKVISQNKVPVQWSVRNNENVKWKKTLPAGGQSGIAVWNDKLFFTTNIPTDNLPYDQIQTQYKGAQKKYELLLSQTKNQLLKSDARFKKIAVSYTQSEKKWETLLASHKGYQKATGNRKNKIKGELLKKNEIGKQFHLHKTNYQNYIHNKSKELKIAYEKYTQLTKDVKGSQKGKDVLLYCLDATTGKELWTKTLKGVIETEYNNGFSDATSPCPMTDGNFVWAINACGAMACYTMNGDVVWERTWHPTEGRPFNKQFDSILFGDWILSSEPPMEGDGTRNPLWNYLHAFDKNTGELVWTTQEALTHYNTPVIGRTKEGIVAVMMGRGGPHGVPERPVGLSLISLEKDNAGNEIWNWEPKEDNSISGWGALSTQHWNKERVSWFYKGDYHVTIDSKNGELIGKKQLKEGKVYTFDTLTDSYTLEKNAKLPHSENERHCNMQVGDFIYYMVRYQPYIARHNTVTGENVFLEVPREIDDNRNFIWHTARANDGLNSKGQRHSSDARVRGHGFQKCFLGSPTMIDDYIYFTNALGMVYVIDTSSESFDGSALKAVNDLGEQGKTWTVNTMSYANGSIYHRTLKEIICIE